MRTKYLELAKKIAQKSDSRFRLGCVIVKKNRILSVGYNNMRKTHTKSNAFGKFLHCEVHALLGLGYQETRNAIAYISRIRKDNTEGMSKPCPSCLEALKLAQIKTICYTTNNGFKTEDL